MFNFGPWVPRVLVRIFLLFTFALMPSRLLFGGTVNVTLDAKTLTSPSQGGVIVAPYYLDINSSNNAPFTPGSLITVICDDFADHVSIGESWTANVTSLATGDLSNTYFKSQPNALNLYEQTAWLMLQTGLYGAPTDVATAGHANSIANINFAIWQIFDSAVSGTSGWTSGTVTGGSAAWWLNEAATKAPTTLSFYNGVQILTPVSNASYPDGRPQEYLAFTPEPSSVLLLGTGIAAIWSRRRNLFAGKR